MAKAISVAPITEEEVKNLSLSVGHRNYKWAFPEEAFNGDWWVAEVPNTDVNSVMNSFRSQCHAVYETKASVRKLRDGRVGLKRLVDSKLKAKK